MTSREIDQVWTRLDAVEKKIDRLVWLVILLAFASGGPQVVGQILSSVQ